MGGFTFFGSTFRPVIVNTGGVVGPLAKDGFGRVLLPGQGPTGFPAQGQPSPGHPRAKGFLSGRAE
jgi:hypothetical protein